MAFLIKDNHRPQGSTGRRTIVEQLTQVSKEALTVPASTTQQLFRVYGGRVKVKLLLGEVTTVIQTQTDNLKVSSKALDNTSTAIGTAVDVASNLDITAMQVGGLFVVEGDGTAGVKSTAGAAFLGTNSGEWIAPQGEIYLTTDATNTGAMKWDIWYEPLDAGAYVVAVAGNQAAI
jgi:hypothetical protein